MFSLKATGMIIDMIKRKQYDPSIVLLSDLLVPVYEYHKLSSDLADLRRKDKQFSQDRMENDPFHQAFSEFTNDLMKMTDDKSPKAKIGRNDPCPCGSGKKYKKCCLLKSL
jgi:uncharacterized protein YecA (UPF0149 family)